MSILSNFIVMTTWDYLQSEIGILLYQLIVVLN